MQSTQVQEKEKTVKKVCYATPVEDILAELETKRTGLDSSEIAKRHEKYGYNTLEEHKKESIFKVFFSQFKDFLVIILLIASLISLVSGNVDSTIIILVVLTMNSLIGTIQHIKAEKSIESLRNMAAPVTKVLRDNKKIEIKSREIVPGDIVLLESGDIVPADGRIIDCFNFKVNESSLTGESESVEKTERLMPSIDIPLGDQKNMVFSGSFVNNGRGEIVVTDTGMNTELGKISQLLSATTSQETPLQRSLEQFGKRLGFTIIGLCGIVFLLTVYHDTGVFDALMFAVALAVAAIPEVLTPVVTIVLAIGTQRLARENAIVKNLKSVESLGCVGVICSDKTGTLTQNKMTVRHIYADHKNMAVDELDTTSKTVTSLMRDSLLCNDATVEVGDPTEIAFNVMAQKKNIDFAEQRKIYPRLGELPFDSDRKMMSTLHNLDNRAIVVTKGALDVILPRAKRIAINGIERDINDDDKSQIVRINNEFAQNGLRVLTFAYHVIDKVRPLTLADEDDFTFVGLAALIDPPREESKDAVHKCIKAGIRPIMITGDHKITACTIARELGIFRDGDNCLEGVELEKMSDEKLASIVKDVSVYARVSPEHKIRIVKAWQTNGYVCAMTGDGVNDAPALKKADIGIAMGITGTEVAKDAASMILSDDNFATIVKAVAVGRNTYINIQRAIKYLLCGNIGAIIAVMYSSIVALPAIFDPVHLLFINLLTDSLPAIAIGLEPQNDEVLADPPRDPNKSMLTRPMCLGILWEGILIAIFVMMAFYHGYGEGDILRGSTYAFGVLCIARLFNGISCRGERNIIALGLFRNIYTLIAFAVGLILINIVLCVPGLEGLFHVARLTSSEIGLVHLYAFLPTLIIQIIKVIKYR